MTTYPKDKWTVEVFLGDTAAQKYGRADCFHHTHKEEGTAQRQYDRVAQVDNVMVRLWHDGRCVRSTARVDAGTGQAGR